MIAGEWVEQLQKSFSDRLIGVLFESIYQLDDAQRATMLAGQAEACATGFAALAEIPSSLDFDGFLERMKTAAPGPVRVTKVSPDELLWTEDHRGECVCPHVRTGLIRLDPKLCGCGATWVRILVERHARRRAEVSLEHSVATGASDCVYRIRLGAPIETHAGEGAA